MVVATMKLGDMAAVHVPVGAAVVLAQTASVAWTLLAGVHENTVPPLLMSATRAVAGSGNAK
jgi:hypothetical protein